MLTMDERVKAAKVKLVLDRADAGVGVHTRRTEVAEGAPPAPPAETSVKAAFLEGYDAAETAVGVPDEQGGLDAWEQSEAKRLTAASPVPRWWPIETAPKGSGKEGPQDTRHPDYVEPPRVWLLLDDDESCVGYWDWYYAECGRGYDGGGTWVEKFSGERVRPTHWMPLPAPPVTPAKEHP